MNSSTGAGAGIGKETAILFASYGAHVVAADKDFASADRTALQIRQSSGDRYVVSCKCDVTDWDEVVAMYELAIKTFGSVDVVVANAGVGEVGGLLRHSPNEERPLVKPMTTTIDVNLTGLLYTVHLAQHYLEIVQLQMVSSGPSEPYIHVKSVILLGSIASWFPLAGAPVYTTTKHAVLDVMRSLDASFTANGARIASVHPFWADTSLVSDASRHSVLLGIPLAPVPRIAGSIFYASTHPDPGTNGAAFLVPDGGALTFMIPRGEFKLGMYQFIDKYSNAKSVALKWPGYHIRVISVLMRLFWKKLLLISGSTSLGVFIVMFFWKRLSSRYFKLRT